jgi:hypothetical protein
MAATRPVLPTRNEEIVPRGRIHMSDRLTTLTDAMVGNFKNYLQATFHASHFISSIISKGSA